MRHSYLLIAFIMLTSCGNQKNQELTNRIDSLQTALDKRTADIDEMTDYLDIVVTGLDSINQQEQIIYSGVDEVTGKKLSRKDIINRIAYLGELLQRQRNRIQSLEDSLDTQNDARLLSLKKIIANQQSQLKEKEKEIAFLQNEIQVHKGQITKLTTDVNTLIDEKTGLQEQLTAQDEILAAQSDIINEGFYIIGKRKALKEAGLINTTLLGLGKSKVNLETADLSKLEKIDIRNFSNELVIPSKKATILSHMPESSYTIVNGDKESKLFIKDPALFWSLSRILVIEIK